MGFWSCLNIAGVTQEIRALSWAEGLSDPLFYAEGEELRARPRSAKSAFNLAKDISIGFYYGEYAGR